MKISVIDNTYEQVIDLYKEIENIIDLLKGKVWKWSNAVKKSRIASNISMIETQWSHLKTHGLGDLDEEFPDAVELTCNNMTSMLIEELLPALEENVKDFEIMLLPIQDIESHIKSVETEMERILINYEACNLDGVKKAFIDVITEARNIIDGISMDFNIRSRIYEMWKSLSDDSITSTSYITFWIFSGYIKSVKPLEILCEHLISEIDRCFDNDISNMGRSMIERIPKTIDKR